MSKVLPTQFCSQFCQHRLAVFQTPPWTSGSCSFLQGWTCQRHPKVPKAMKHEVKMYKMCSKCQTRVDMKVQISSVNGRQMAPATWDNLCLKPCRANQAVQTVVQDEMIRSSSSTSMDLWSVLDHRWPHQPQLSSSLASNCCTVWHRSTIQFWWITVAVSKPHFARTNSTWLSWYSVCQMPTSLGSLRLVINADLIAPHLPSWK